MKKCNSCEETDIENFGKDVRNKDGLQGKCRSCQNLSRRNRYKEDESYRELMKFRQLKHSKKANIRAKKHVKELSDFYVIASLKRGTNLTSDDIKKNPELIKLKKQIILNKRLCRKLKT